MRKPISFPLKQGLTSRQAHADLPPEAIYEREISRHGFFGSATHMHHKHPPTSWSSWEGELRPRAFDLNALKSPYPLPWEHGPLLHNNDCQIHFWNCDRSMNHLVRNADGDELFFVHRGVAELFCDYGHLSLTEGDYLLMPRNTNWRLEPQSTLTPETRWV